MFKKLWNRIDAFIARVEEHQTVTIGTGIGLLVAVLLLRAFFENYASPDIFTGLAPWFVVLESFLHITAVILLCSVFLSFVLKRKGTFILHTAILASPVILTAPLFDLAVSGGRGYCSAYLGDSGWRLLAEFATYFGHILNCGITPGVRFEVALVLVGVTLLAYRATRSLLKTVIAVIGTYTIIFISLSVPGILFTLGNGFGFSDVNVFLGTMLQNSLLSSAHSYITTSNGAIGVSMANALFMARLSWIVCLATAAILYCQQNNLTVKGFIKKIHFLPVALISFLALFGMRLAYQLNEYAGIPATLPDILAYIILFLVIAAAGELAARRNDEQKSVTIFVLSLIILSGALVINYAVFMCMAVFLACAYLYSAPPLRLNRFFLSRGITLSFAGLAVVLSGYGFFSLGNSITLFPPKLALFLVVFLFLASQIPDFKTMAGDSENNMRTFPVLLGEKKARYLIALAVLIGGAATGAYIHAYFEVFSLAIYAASITFFTSALFYKIDQRASLALFYFIGILAILYL